MSQVVAIVLAIVGIIVLLLGLYPSGLMGRLNGVGGIPHHTTADAAVVIGAILLGLGIYSLIRRRAA